MSQIYSDYRKNIKTGDLLGWSKTHIHSIGSLILYLYQKIFKVKYTHVAVVVKLNGRLFVVEAVPNNVRLMPLSSLSSFYHIQTNLDVKTTSITKLFTTIGKVYSIFELISMLFRTKGDNNKFYCSELAAEFYLGMDVIDDKEYGITPSSLMDAVAARTHQPVYVVLDKKGASAGI